MMWKRLESIVQSTSTWQSCNLNPDVYNSRASQMLLVVKNLPAIAGDPRGVGSILGSGRSAGGGHGNLLQYSCLENPMDRGAWEATVHRVSKSRTQLKWLSMHTWTYSTVQESTQKHNQLQRTHTCDNVHQTRELTYMVGHVNGHLWKCSTWTFLCRGLPVFPSAL